MPELLRVLDCVYGIAAGRIQRDHFRTRTLRMEQDRSAERFTGVADDRAA